MFELKKPLRIILSFVLLAVVLVIAVPKSYVHSLMGHHHSEAVQTEGLSVRADNDTRDCDFERFDTPVYYTVFKFILDFLPVNSGSELSYKPHKDSLVKAPGAHVPLRGPPAV